MGMVETPHLAPSKKDSLVFELLDTSHPQYAEVERLGVWTQWWRNMHLNTCKVYLQQFEAQTD